MLYLKQSTAYTNASKETKKEEKNGHMRIMVGGHVMDDMIYPVLCDSQVVWL